MVGMELASRGRVFVPPRRELVHGGRVGVVGDLAQADPAIDEGRIFRPAQVKLPPEDAMRLSATLVRCRITRRTPGRQSDRRG